MTSARLVAALLLSAAPTAAAAQTPPISIGVADWTHPDAFGTRPAEPTRGLVPGEYVVLQEEVETNDVGAADFLFANRSRLLVGPDCAVVLDRRYYDNRLDVDVKEYRLDTRTRCIAKADNLGAADDAIVLNTPHGQIVLRDGAFYASMAGEEASGDLPAAQEAALQQAGMQDAMIVAGLAFGPQGSAVLRGREGVGEVVLRRGGFLAVIGQDGAARGPFRDVAGVTSGIQNALNGLLPVADRRNLDLDYALDPDLVRPRPGPDIGILEPPPGCRALDCAPVLVPEEDPITPSSPLPEGPDEPIP